MENQDDKLEKIWRGDLLGRRSEADLLQHYIETESEAFLKSDRKSSIVLAIDAEYGQGKSWFLDRLSQQLALSHPVARIDAWADDASEEPLTAFMSSIDDALSPYLTKSQQLRDRLARAKVAALPVMGRLVKGAVIKGLSKVAGDGAEDAVGDAFEGALEKAKTAEDSDTSGLAEAVEGVLEEVGKEIDSLVDRRGAAMLAEYRQRRKSRVGFRRNMSNLVAALDESDVAGKSPLIVVIDELDRCRPDYAIKVLEEIKHFFEVQGVVFLLAIHGQQLTHSVEAVYGSSFDAKSYMLRFFTRTYKMRRLSVSEIVAGYFASWEDQPAFVVLQLLEGNEPKIPSVERYLSKLLDEYKVTPRETYPILDALRLFAIDTGRQEKIQLHALVQYLVRFVRGLGPSEKLVTTGNLKLASIEKVGATTVARKAVTLAELLDRLGVWSLQIGRARYQDFGRSAADNLAKEIVEAEFSRRTIQTDNDIPSVTYSYPARVEGMMRFLSDMLPLEDVDKP